jgi:hypothetical protein
MAKAYSGNTQQRNLLIGKIATKSFDTLKKLAFRISPHQINSYFCG